MNEYERGITLYSVQQEIFLSFSMGVNGMWWLNHLEALSPVSPTPCGRFEGTKNGDRMLGPRTRLRRHHLCWYQNFEKVRHDQRDTFSTITRLIIRHETTSSPSNV